MFVNPLTTDPKYYRHNTENLLEPIKTHLCSKPNSFSEYFIVFLQFTLNSEHFKQTLEPHSLSISEIIHSEKRVY